jgi:hypothetical protein
MMHRSPTNLFICLLLLTLAAFGSACNFDKAGTRRVSAETVRSTPTESPTPGYKPLKRVSRDVIDTDQKTEKKPEKKTEKKEETVKIKAKK